MGGKQRAVALFCSGFHCFAWICLFCQSLLGFVILSFVAKILPWLVVLPITCWGVLEVNRGRWHLMTDPDIICHLSIAKHWLATSSSVDANCSLSCHRFHVNLCTSLWLCELMWACASTCVLLCASVWVCAHLCASEFSGITDLDREQSQMSESHQRSKAP